MEDAAVGLYQQLTGNMLIPEAAREDIRREATHLCSKPGDKPGIFSLT